VSGHQGERTFGELVADFFGFGDDDETYSEAVRRGSYVVTVDAVTDQEADRAESVMTGFRPIDIDQRVSEWRQSGWQPTRAGLSQSQSSGLDQDHAQGAAVAGTGNKHIEAVIPVAEEHLEVGKQAVQPGRRALVERSEPLDRGRR
jgi:hypothetical protein